MVMTYPISHRPRYEDFELKGFLDETLREGAEYCLSTVENNEFFRKILDIVENKMNIIYTSKRKDFTEISKRMNEFYSTDVMNATDILEISQNLTFESNLS